MRVEFATRRSPHAPTASLSRSASRLGLPAPGYDLTVYTQASLEMTAHALGGMAPDSQHGTVRVDAQDCAGYPAAGIALVVGSEQPIAATRYFVGDGAALSASAEATDASGVALAFGVPAGPVGVAGRLVGQPVGGAMAYAHAGAVTSVVVRP
jgi:hypothetical protein